MSDILMRVEFRNPQQAHAALTGQAWPWIKAHTFAGRALVGEFRPLEDARSLQQNSFMWGWVYKQISEQARLNGTGAAPDGWHLYYKRKFLGYRFTKTVLPGRKRPSITRELRSTSKLSVRAMSKYLEQVMADAATEFGVSFDGKRWEDWQP